MGRINETVATFNSALRTLLFGAVVVGAGIGGWKGYSLYNKPQKMLDETQRQLEQVAGELAAARTTLAERDKQVALLDAEVKIKDAAIAKLETSKRLLKLRHRIAHLRVLDQAGDADTGEVTTTVEFYEVDDAGKPIDDRRQQFEIEGDRVYVECLVAKFDDRFVEENDLDRHTAVCLFQRIFGEHQEPKDGFAIDQCGLSHTSTARSGEVSDLEKKIWADFWAIANDPAKARELGIRAAHADAPSIKAEPGVTYELELRSTGEFTLRPQSEAGDEGEVREI
jgi:hypothetical protein